jgi:hypothetical protein
MTDSFAPDGQRLILHRDRRWFGPAEMAAWVIALTLLVYPLFGTLVAFTSSPSLVASVPVRALVLLVALSLILRTRSAVWFSTGGSLLFAFWAIYLTRLLWDWWVVGIPIASYFTLHFVVFCIPTAMALMHAPAIDERKLSRILLVLGVVVCILAIIEKSINLAGARAGTEDAEGRLFLETVNPITFGHVGVTTILAALGMSRYCTRKIEWLGLSSVAGLGCAVVVIAGSRGPLLTLLVCITLAALLVKGYRWLLLPLIAGGLLMFGQTSGDTQTLLASRVTSSLQNESPEIRVLMAVGAVEQFLESPLVGSAIVERQFEDYPHNPFLEAAMAVGVTGLFLLVIIHFRALRRIVGSLRRGNLLVPLLAVQAVLAAQVSGSLAISASLWLFLALYAGAEVRSRRRLPRHHQIPLEATPLPIR